MGTSEITTSRTYLLNWCQLNPYKRMRIEQKPTLRIGPSTFRIGPSLIPDINNTNPILRMGEQTQKVKKQIIWVINASELNKNPL